MQKLQAHAFIRWSDPKQEEGDSLRRQNAAIDEWEQKNEEQYEVIRHVDAGKSAFHGDNLTSGEFGKWLTTLDDERPPEGTLVLFEEQDRLLRQPASKLLDIRNKILRAGVAIHYIRENYTDTPDDLDEPFNLFTAILKTTGNYEESRKKAWRVAEAWQDKRQTAAETNIKLTSQTKAWLIPITRPLPRDKKEVSRFVVDEAKAEVVKEIYRLYATGDYSYRQILAHLKRNKTPPISKQRYRTIKDKKGMPIDRVPLKNDWTQAYIQQLLQDRSVIGEVTLCTVRKKRRTKTDTVIKDYYPQIIQQSLFEEVQTLRVQRQTQRSRSENTINTFAGLVWDHRGSKMFCNANSRREHRLISSDFINKKANANEVTLPWDKMEELLLLCLNELGTKTEDKTIAVNARKESLLAERRKIQARLDGKISDEVFSQLIKELEQVRKQLNELEQYVPPTPQKELKECILRRDKKELKKAIKTIVEKVVCFPERSANGRSSGAAAVVLKTGDVRWVYLYPKSTGITKYHKLYIGKHLVGCVHKYGHVSTVGVGIPYHAVDKMVPKKPDLLKQIQEGFLPELNTDKTEKELQVLHCVVEQSGNPYATIFDRIEKTGEYVLPDILPEMIYEDYLGAVLERELKEATLRSKEEAEEEIRQGLITGYESFERPTDEK